MKESTRRKVEEYVQECLEQHLKDYHVDLTRAESTTSPMVHSLGRMIRCLEVDLFNYMNGAVNLYLRLLYKGGILGRPHDCYYLSGYN